MIVFFQQEKHTFKVTLFLRSTLTIKNDLPPTKSDNLQLSLCYVVYTELTNIMVGSKGKIFLSYF